MSFVKKVVSSTHEFLPYPVGKIPFEGTDFLIQLLPFHSETGLVTAHTECVAVREEDLSAFSSKELDGFRHVLQSEFFGGFSNSCGPYAQEFSQHIHDNIPGAKVGRLVMVSDDFELEAAKRVPVSLKNDPSLEKHTYHSFEAGQSVYKKIDGDSGVIGASYHALSYVQIGQFHMAWDGTVHNRSTHRYGRVFVSTDPHVFKEMLLKRYCVRDIFSIRLEQDDPMEQSAYRSLGGETEGDEAAAS